jgi:cytoskeletal protein RodZ
MHLLVHLRKFWRSIKSGNSIDRYDTIPSMDIKELNKTQLVLLTLLITFVVSVATGIITVSLMQQMPKAVPQTINNVIQRTIERVVSEPAPTAPETKPTTNTQPGKDTSESTNFIANDAVVSIYPILPPPPQEVPAGPEKPVVEPKALGQGVIISDIGLILVESSILNEATTYKVILNKMDFDASVLKKYGNGFTILKISPKKEPVETKTN